MAICEINDNWGTLRKQIWSRMLEQFPNALFDYRDFLYCVQHLEFTEKLVNKKGYFFVNDAVY
jgi:hypothetical protein